MKRLEVFESEDGVIFRSEAQCLEYEAGLAQTKILGGLRISWFDTGPAEVSDALKEAGFQIVRI